MDNKEVLEVVGTGVIYCDRLLDAIKNAAQMFRDDKINEGSALMVQMVEALEWVIEVVVSTKSLQDEEVDFDDINEKMSIAIEALENEDYYLLGDVLEYELLVGVSYIKEILENIKEKLAVLN